MVDAGGTCKGVGVPMGSSARASPPRVATFDALSAVGAAIRGVDAPFGGLQL